jgi:hypothetical protein
MRDENPLRTARRRTKRGEQNRCLLCGRGKPIELHHPVGKSHDPPFTTPLCLACHSLATENLRLANVDMRCAPDANERVRRSLNASAVFLEMLADAQRRWANSLPLLQNTKTGQITEKRRNNELEENARQP